MEMYKILYVVSTLKRSGPINQLYDVICNLDSNRYEPYLLTLSPEPENSRQNEFEQAGVHVQSLGHGRLAGVFLNRSGLIRVVQDCKPDLIHTQGFRADCLLKKIPVSCPWVLTVHNDPWVDFPMEFGKVQGSWMAQKHSHVIRHSSLAICCSKTVEAVFRARYQAQNIRSIQNGVDMERYHPVDSSQREKIREKLGFPKGEKIFLSVNVLFKRKNTQTLINGFRLAKLEHSRLILLGDGPERSMLEALAADCPNTQFLGHVTNIHEYLSASDFLVSASLSEGLPCSVLEAMASGLPVILSDIPSHRELLALEDNRNDFLFPAESGEALAGILRETTHRDWKFLSNKMTKTAREEFSSAIMSKKYQETYEKQIADYQKSSL